MLQTSLLSPEALSPTLICCILSFDVCILPEELVCHKNSQIHMWSFLKPDQLFPLKSRRNTSVWPLKPLEKQWKGLQHRLKAFTAADAKDAKWQAYLCLGRWVGTAASATVFKGGVGSFECFLVYSCMPKHLALQSACHTLQEGVLLYHSGTQLAGSKSEKLWRCSPKLQVSSGQWESQMALHSTHHSTVKNLFCTKLHIIVTLTFQYRCDAIVQLESDGLLHQQERKTFDISQMLKDGISENRC